MIMCHEVGAASCDCSNIKMMMSFMIVLLWLECNALVLFSFFLSRGFSHWVFPWKGFFKEAVL